MINILLNYIYFDKNCKNFDVHIEFVEIDRKLPNKNEEQFDW